MSHAGSPEGGSGSDEGYETVSSAVTHEGQLSRIRVDTVRMPDGDHAEREIVEHPDAVAVVPVDGDEVVLLRQYRHPFGAYFLELPAGKLDQDGEAPATAAKRELVEETEISADDLTELVRFQNSAGWNDECTTIYLATGLRPAEADGFEARHEEADMEVIRMPLRDAVAMAHRGEITDAKTLIGLLLAAARVPEQGTP